MLQAIKYHKQDLTLISTLKNSQSSSINSETIETMFLFKRNKSNFAAGPSKLPLEVLREVQSELLNYHGTGMSVMELAHRDPIYNRIQEDAKSLCRSLL